MIGKYLTRLIFFSKVHNKLKIKKLKAKQVVTTTINKRLFNITKCKTKVLETL